MSEVEHETAPDTDITPPDSAEPTTSTGGAEGSILALQRAAGNRATSRMVDGDPPGDPGVPSHFVERAAAGTGDVTPVAGASKLQRSSYAPDVQRDFWETASNVGSAVVGGIQDAAGAVYDAGTAVVGGIQDAGNAIYDAGVAAVEGAQDAFSNWIYTGQYDDLDATQYLVSGTSVEDGRLVGGRVEAIRRNVDQDGTVRYVLYGLVTGYDGNRPIIQEYDPPREMDPNWLPTVTHVNGMNVTPQGGIESAQRLQLELIDAGGEVVLGSDVPQVLYTYSGHYGIAADVVDCVAGKLYIDDDVTRVQTDIILDAVRNQHRTAVSAHSRGTIKTDNAILNAHATLTSEYLPALLQDPAIIAQTDAAIAQVQAHPQGPGINPMMLRSTYIHVFARQQAEARATQDLNAYVQVVFAGNAVQLPTDLVDIDIVVATWDPVTIAFGKYFEWAAGDNIEMTESDTTVEGQQHGFDDNYAANVARLIVADIGGGGEDDEE